MRPLPRSRPPASSWLIPALAAATWSGVMTMVADAPAATQRSLVFLGGPLVLLSGLHARLFGFLHAPERARWLPLPVDPLRHWRAGLRGHAPGFAVATLFGAATLLLSVPGMPGARGVRADLGLMVEFVWLAAFAGLLEPLASACAAVLGRRFPEDSRAHELQRSLGGGWTTAEAVVHLYAPAFGLGLAVLLAMPGQLSWERWLDGHDLSGVQIAVGLAPLPLALLLRLAAPALYSRGVWEAVPWLTEATRTLAGPPRPEATPGWAEKISDPWLRLLVVQFWRMTPLPGLRLVLVVGLAIAAALRAQPPTGPFVAVAMAVIGAWIVPAGAVLRDRPARARMFGALPLPALARRGHGAPAAAVALALPVLALLASLALRALV